MRITIDLAVVHVKPRMKSHLSNVVHFTDSNDNRFIWTTAVEKNLKVGQKIEAQISVNEELYDDEGKFVRISHVSVLNEVDELRESTYTEKPFSIMDRPGEKTVKRMVPDDELLNDIEKTLSLLQKK
ncbi:hypothetical protein [Jeotgalibacillus proteolyticus]|uniref:Uncharacterized protein n=1 Tax=Jeotgalibacillus proteolyticus TaxID=2082395 RepID=A0A2S5GCC3_9BACL|nr:hypothetical protein [Jeotgalibacillus proteolyticus]PPA70687.1 hypothetical protein C4B60_07760 [Jeotgalibacillus proteolyticus]